MGDWLQMELRRSHTIGLWSMFLKYLLTLVVGTILLGSFYMITFSLAMNSGLILPANYAEKQIAKNKEAIIKSEPFDSSLIPHTCNYGLFDKSYNYLEGNFDKDKIEDAKLFLLGSDNYYNRYIIVERDRDICVIQYDISAHFASPVLHEIFPKLELIGVLSFFILFILLVVFTALLFAKKLKKELAPVLEATLNIKERRLEFEVKSSKIQEFNDVLNSLGDMKRALAQSLKKEWETEQRRKEHISALAHDIKTPLTVIKGNAELLMEEMMTPDMREYVECIDRSSDQIEKYISLLIEATKGEVGLEMKVSPLKIRDFIKQVIEESTALCRSYQVGLTTQINVTDKILMIDEQSVLRALLNVVQNALEHSHKEKEIRLNLLEEGDELIIQIEDFGLGFTQEALNNGTQQFFTENTARTGKHYGLGLYMTKQVIEGHKGELTYGNKANGSGALVTIKLPVNTLEN